MGENSGNSSAQLKQENLAFFVRTYFLPLFNNQFFAPSKASVEIIIMLPSSFRRKSLFDLSIKLNTAIVLNFVYWFSLIVVNDRLPDVRKMMFLGFA
jgi:hypothetical protein